MKKLLAALAIAFVSIAALAQTTVSTTTAANPNTTILSGTTPPATCRVGPPLFFDTDATAGSNLLGCTSANTWTTMGGTLSGSGAANRLAYWSSASALTGSASLTFNSGTGALTATSFVGNLTGNASGTAATVTTAAQPSITSVGTLTGLTVTAAPTFSALTTTRIPFAGTAGLLGDSANLRYSATMTASGGKPGFQLGAASADEGVVLGVGSASNGAVWFSRTDNTYALGTSALYGNGTSTILNAPSGGIVYITLNSVEKFNQAATAGQGPVITAGTATTAVSPLSVTQTLNNGAITFPGVTITSINTASVASSSAFKVLAGTTGATEALKVRVDGAVTMIAGNLYLGTSATYAVPTATVQDRGSGIGRLSLTSNTSSFVAWATSNDASSTPNLALSNVSAGVLGVGTGGAAGVDGAVQAATFTAGTAHDTADGSAAAVGYRFGARANYGIFFSSGSGTVSFSNNSTVEATMNAGIVVRTGGLFSWSSGVPGTNAGDTAFSKISAGIVGVGTGAAGSVAGGIQLATLQASPVSTVLTLTAGAIGMGKMTASASAPGATGGKLELVCGTNAGSAKLIVAAGTSATAVTVVDNIGSGVSGC